jgi:tetrahedral aminopeptidase
LKDKELVNVLFKLAGADGVSGYEDSVIKITGRYFEQYGCSVKKDRFGNLIAFKFGQPQTDEEKTTLVLVAHIDEIGAMVTKIEAGGFLRFSSIGGLDTRTLPGQPVIVHGRKKLKGVIGAAPPHLLTENDKKTTDSIDKLFIDVGLRNESVKKLVSVGDIISLEQKPILMNNKLGLTGKAIDNRAGIAALIYCAAELANQNHPTDLCFVASLQEEIGLRGAVTAAFGYEPDYGLAVDVTMVGDTPKASNMAVSLGLGPAIKVKDNSIISHPKVRRLMVETAERKNIDYQLEVLEQGGTDAGAIHLTRGGVPSGALSIPCRYIHSPSEIIDSYDLYNAVGLLENLLTMPWPIQKENI